MNIHRRNLLVCSIIAAIYVLAWIATAFFGASTIRQTLIAQTRPEFRDVSNSPGAREHSWGPWLPDDGKEPWFYCRTSSPAPFIVQIEHGWMAQPLMGGGTDSTYFWFFGYIHRLSHVSTWAS